MTRVLVLVSALVVSLRAQPSTVKRHALLVGNSVYEALTPLPSAIEEIKALGPALEQAGFEVTAVTNARLPEFNDRNLVPFLRKLKDGDVCLFYFSGYTVQATNDEDNFLLPVNFDPKSADPVSTRSYGLGAIQQRMNEKTARGLKIFVLEAPRPLPTTIRGTSSAGPQTPNLDESRESLFAFGASQGQSVQGTGPANVGLFTQRVIDNIKKPGMRLTEVFEDAKRAVQRATDNKQIPLVLNNVVTEGFYFHEPLKVPDPKPVVTPTVATLLPGTPANNRKDHHDYVWIPSGKFKMGCVSSDKLCLKNEKPQHEVNISKGLWMGRNEVEVAKYQVYVAQNKLRMPPGPIEDGKWRMVNNPIGNVTWQQARDFCAWAGGRLPTEAEWEYAARTGLQDAVYPLNNENSRDKANFYGKQGADIFERTAPVRSFDANAWGLHDMAGNVWEWVEDFYSETYYKESPGADPKGPASGKEHVRRGGSFDSDPKKHLRISIRESSGSFGVHIGMRCVLDDTPESRKLLGR